MATLGSILDMSQSLQSRSNRNDVPMPLQRTPSINNTITVPIRELNKIDSHATFAPTESSIGVSSDAVKNISTVLSDSDPLTKACKRGDTEAVREILQQCSSEAELHRYVNARDKSGSTSIFHTVWNGYHSTLELLLENGAAVNVQNNKANTALHLACEQAHYNVIQLLLSYGANPQLTNYQHKHAYQTPNDPTVQINVENFVKRFWLEVQRAHHGQTVGNNHTDAKLKISRKPAVWKTKFYYEHRNTLIDRLDTDVTSKIHSTTLRNILHLNNNRAHTTISRDKHNRYHVNSTTDVLDRLVQKCDQLTKQASIKSPDTQHRSMTHSNCELLQYQIKRAINDLSTVKQQINAEVEESKHNDDHKHVRATQLTREGKRALIHSTLQRTDLPSQQLNNDTATNNLQKTMFLVEQTAVEVEKTVEQHKPTTPFTNHTTQVRRPHTTELYQPKQRKERHRHHSIQYENFEYPSDELLTQSVLNEHYPLSDRNNSVLLQQQIIRRLARQILSD